MRVVFVTLIVILLNSALLKGQEPLQITVKASEPVAAVQPTMWGVFFEDINFAADGGLFAELVKNRSFEFSIPLMGWRLTRQNGNGRLLPTFYSPLHQNNPRYLEVVVEAPDGSFGITNEGFRGIGLRQGEKYNFSVYAGMKSGTGLKMHVELNGAEGEVLASAEIDGFSQEWKTYTAVLVPVKTEQKATLKVMFRGNGRIGIDVVSLFPADTWKGRPGGLRKDIATMIADLKPGFLRFPGGCIVEGRDLTNRYQWKHTVGPVDERKMIINRWNTEMRDRQAPDYFQSFGLGFFEYFQFSEDIGAEPLPILNCGMSCQFNAGEVVPLNEMDPYIQDAMDLIEFANGDVTTKWGGLRSSMGHPAPFNLKFIGVGNEQWDEQYIERYRFFEKALKEKYPQIKIVSGSGPYASGRLFDYAWGELRKLSPALIDEHYYMPPEWFLKNAARYDNYDRKGPAVFAGEYAAHWNEGKDSESRNTWYSALAEAAFMTGLERNADLVHMASYAPLLSHVEAWQWRPDLIWFDNLRVMASPNYLVQKMYSTHRGTDVIPVTAEGMPLTGKDSLYASGTSDRNTGNLYLKIINTSSAPKTVELTLDVTPSAGQTTIEVLKGKKNDYNTISKPDLIKPETRAVKPDGNKIKLVLDPLSASTLIVASKNRK